MNIKYDLNAFHIGFITLFIIIMSQNSELLSKNNGSFNKVIQLTMMQQTNQRNRTVRNKN